MAIHTNTTNTAKKSNDDPIPRPLSLYAHVPFCTSPCFYCACTRIITRDTMKAALYLERLYREIELQNDLVPEQELLDLSAVARCYGLPTSPDFARAGLVLSTTVVLIAVSTWVVIRSLPGSSRLAKSGIFLLDRTDREIAIGLMPVL